MKKMIIMNVVLIIQKYNLRFKLKSINMGKNNNYEAIFNTNKFLYLLIKYKIYLIII